MVRESNSEIPNQGNEGDLFEEYYRRCCDKGSIALGAALKDRREQLNLSLTALVMKTGIPYEYLWATERGSYSAQDIGPDTLRMIWNVLGPFPPDAAAPKPHGLRLHLVPESAVRFRHSDRVGAVQEPLSELCERCHRAIQFGEATCPYCGLRRGD